MAEYDYSGQAAFGEDRGTFWPQFRGAGQSLDSGSLARQAGAGRMAELANSQPVVWFVDDELGNREWFRDKHRDDFPLVTFSSRAHFKRALLDGFPCDAVVTDIFFPAEAVTTEQQAKALLSIYPEIDACRVSELPALWASKRLQWSLDGFSIARDAASRCPPIPCFLFSRKATMLLGVDDYISEPLPVGNSYWLLEKVPPTAADETARTAARAQTTRIISTLGVRRARWRKLLDSFNVGPEEAAVSLQELRDG